MPISSKALDHLSESARSDLKRRYPDSSVTRAIDKALERLRTLEQVMTIPASPIGETNVQPK